MQLKIDKGFAKRAQGIFGKYTFEVGILENGPHKLPMERPPGAENFSANLTSYAGGTVRKKSRQDGPLTIAEVAAENEARIGLNFLIEPFKKQSSAIVKFANEFFKLAFGRSEKKRAENLLQAIVRNPILRGEYGKNAPSTVREKGFYRPMIDTGQLFKAIKARCTVRSKGV